MSKFFKQKNKGFTRTPSFGVAPKGGGFTLVETLVAISIFSLSILGLLTVLSQGIADTGYAKKKMMAAYLAQEGIEYMRNKRDTYVLYDLAGTQNGWNTFKSVPLDSITPPAPADSSFTRTIQRNTVPVLNPGSDEVKITATVSWAQGSGNYSITFSENLFNWME